MKYPETLLVPLLMLADYFLTVLSAVWLEKGYANHFRREHFELNPIWQKDIAAKRWFNPRHLLLTFLVSAVVILAAELSRGRNIVIEGALGAMIVCYGAVVGRHLSNLLTFRYVIRRPGEITGQVTMSHRLALSMSLYQTAIVAMPIVLIAAFSPSSFAIGGCIGVLLLAAVHLYWIRKDRQTKAPVTETQNRASV